MQRSSPAHLSFWILSWEAEVKYQLQPLQLSWAGVGYPDRHISVTRPSPFIPVHLHSWAQPSSLSGERTSQENTTHCLFKTASCSFHFHPGASLSEQLGSAPKFTTVWREGHPCWEEYKQDKMTEAENANTAELRWCASVHAGCVCVCVYMAAIDDLADMLCAEQRKCLHSVCHCDGAKAASVCQHTHNERCSLMSTNKCTNPARNKLKSSLTLHASMHVPKHSQKRAVFQGRKRIKGRDNLAAFSSDMNPTILHVGRGTEDSSLY